MISSGRPPANHLVQERQQLGQDSKSSSRAAGCRRFPHRFERVGVGHEVGRQVALVELHAFGVFEDGLGALAFIDGDDAFLADLFHGVGHQVADVFVAVGGDGGDALVVLAALDLLGQCGDRLVGDLGGFGDAALDHARD